jgi:hypothetical protein
MQMFSNIPAFSKKIETLKDPVKESAICHLLFRCPLSNQKSAVVAANLSLVVIFPLFTLKFERSSPPGPPG